MHIYNAPPAVIDLLKPPLFNESGSRVHYEPTTGSIDDKQPFTAFLNDDKDAISLLKNINGCIILFDAHPSLFIRLIQHNINKNNVLLVGVQHWTEGDYLFMRTNNLLFYPLREITIDDKHDICDAIMSVVKDAARLHIHVATSVLDATGMTPREILYFIHRLRLLKSTKSISITATEMQPSVTAKIIQELF